MVCVELSKPRQSEEGGRVRESSSGSGVSLAESSAAVCGSVVAASRGGLTSVVVCEQYRRRGVGERVSVSVVVGRVDAAGGAVCVQRQRQASSG